MIIPATLVKNILYYMAVRFWKAYAVNHLSFPAVEDDHHCEYNTPY